MLAYKEGSQCYLGTLNKSVAAPDRTALTLAGLTQSCLGQREERREGGREGRRGGKSGTEGGAVFTVVK